MERSSTSPSYQVFIGIDISKSWMDVVALRPEQSKFQHRFSNTSQGFSKLWSYLKKYLNEPVSGWLFCMEHTGLYTRPLIHYLLAREAAVWMQSGLEIKRSIGLQRGKNDQIDAHRIAQYAWRNHPDVELVSLAKTSLEKLQDLIANRRRILKAKNALEKPIKELEAFDPKNAKMLKKANRKALQGLEASLENIDKLINEALEEDPQLKERFDLATSVKSVGKILALHLIVATQGFSRMMDGRKIACHAGVAPFQNQSGSSRRGKNRTSKLANMQLKAVLHMAALSALRYDPELRQYYLKKVAEGKNKMSVINAIRNKILHRVISVVKRGYPYIEFPLQNA